MATAVYLITGGASGIGLVTARALQHRGVVVVTDIDEDALEAANEEGFVTYKLDVSSTKDWRKIAEKLRKEYGRLDGLVHNAGIAPIAPLSETNDATIDDVLSVNLRSILVGTRETWDLLVAVNASVVVVASVAALVGQDRSAAYVASKGAAVAATRALALELAPFGVRVNSVSPGTTMTPMLQRHFDSLPDGEDVLAQTKRRHPIGRLLQAEDVAPTILHLLSPEASTAMTGSNIVVDGGLTASFDFGNSFSGGSNDAD